MTYGKAVSVFPLSLELLISSFFCVNQLSTRLLNDTFFFFPFFFQEPRRRHICLVSSIIELLVQIKYILNVLITGGVLGMLYSFLTCPSFFGVMGLHTMGFGVQCCC